MDWLRKGIGGIPAGFLIAVGGMVFLSSEHVVVGAFFFGVGLLGISLYGLPLFTGRVGYLAEQRTLRYLAELAAVWLGNGIGCLIGGLFARVCRPDWTARAAHIMQTIKLPQTALQTLMLGIVCGLLMYIAVDNFKNNESPVGKYVGIFICVPAFILAGLEHSVANMFYIAAGGQAADSGPILLFLLVTTVGNGIGACILPWFKQPHIHRKG